MKRFETSNTVADIEVIETKGPWQSKSGGHLDVLYAMPHDRLKSFLDFDNPEFAEMPGDMRGLRSYTVSGIPEGSIGGKEWHRARNEYVTALGGSAVWQCVDMHGGEKDIVLDGTNSVIMPPGILHTYQALENDTQLLVVANTLFVPDDARTHDTFSRDDFYDLQAEHMDRQ